MAEADPNCPRCTGPVRPDWDWCLNCGYDPEGLKPPGWMPGSVPAEPESTPGHRGHRGQRGRRDRRAANASAAKASATAAAIDLRTPSMPALVTSPPVTARPPATPASRAGEPAPGGPDRQRRLSAERASDPQPAAPTQPRPGIALATPFSLPPNRVDLIGATVAVLAAAAMAAVAVTSAGSLPGGTALNQVVTALFICLCGAMAAGLAAQAYALVKVKVVIGPDELVATNRLGRPRRAELSQIFSVTLSTRHYDVGLGRHHQAEMPYVQVTDGAGFWIDALGGRSGQAPTPEQMAVLEGLHQVVARYRVAPPVS